MSRKIGFIGLGIMGKPMAINLIEAGHTLTIYDINSKPVKALVALGAYQGMSSKDVAEKSEIIITMLPNSLHVKQVILGENGVLEGLSSGKIIIDMSSIAPLVSQEICSKVAEKGVVMLDAPVSGGEPKAIDGTLSIMVGGCEKAFEHVKDILLKMGRSVVRVGDIGSGNITKLANQIIVAINISAMSEAMVLATKAGVNPERVFEAIRGGLAGSTVLDAKMPKILERNFEPGFRIELHIKDLMNALNTAHEIGVSVPISSQVFEMMKALRADGKVLDDHCGIIKFYESMAKTEVNKCTQNDA
ncbi:MAG: 2-hydroxy-3-oxopropionate reductase [Clostridia bacterium]|nr:2-hydroxy-3-oxopropionate reductase [Clostridia bacterium]